MNAKAQSDIRRKLKVLNYAKEIGNIAYVLPTIHQPLPVAIENAKELEADFHPDIPYHLRNPMHHGPSSSYPNSW